MTAIFWIALILAAAALIVPRVLPHDADRWHEDPATTTASDGAGAQLIGRKAPRFPGHPNEVLGELIEIALSRPRVKLLEGGADEGLVTFVARTRVLGLPDYVTFKAVDEGSVTKISAISRSRFAGYDWGVNRARLEDWLGELSRRLPPE